MKPQDIGKILGGRKTLKREIHTYMDIISLVRTGLPVTAVRYFFEEALFGQEELTRALKIPGRTFARRMKAANRFDPVESEKLVRCARTYAFAKEVFGNDAVKAREWMRRPNRALENTPPIELLDSDFGAEQVEDVLGRLKEGVLS